jgi:phage-related protein (TIGR01555 family)
MKTRNDALQQHQDDIGQRLNSTGTPFGSGWLMPQAAWATYSQNGVVRQIITRLATRMLSKDWTYKNADVQYEWGDIQSKLETLGLASKLRSCVIWKMIFGGAGILVEVDDSNRPLSEPLEPNLVRSVKGLRAMTCLTLRPYPAGRTWDNCDLFEDNYNIAGKGRLIHRSRVIVVVANDVPTDLGTWSTNIYNTMTRWPPSWIETIYSSLCDWKDTDKNVGTIVRTLSLLSLNLEGFRKAQTSPDSTEADEIEATLDAIAANLDNNGLLIIDSGDSLNEVGRNTSGLDKLVNEKKLTFVANTGFPKELVLMEAVGNLGTNSGPMDAYDELADGLRVDELVGPITRLTDILLGIERRKAGPDDEIPTEYTVEFDPLKDLSDKEKAEKRLDEARSRELDAKAGTPHEVLMGDPALNVYPGMPEYRERLEAEKDIAAEAEAVAAKQVPIEQLEATAEIARRLGVSPSTVISMREAGVIEGRKVGSRWRFHWPSVLEAINGAGGVEEAEEQAEEVEQAEPGSEPEADARLDSGLGLSDRDHFGSVYGASVAMREIFAVLERVAPADLPVLITGESGTGKEGIARGLHGDREGPFTAVNCAALPDSPAEIAEFLGVLAAGGGTLFLDEVGELPPAAQGAVLRVLAGPDLTARIVSATWRDPSWLRLDLYNRLAGVEVEVPPLRDREDDVVVLARMFYDGPLDDPFSPDALAAIRLHSWPGNVRELKNAVARASLFAGREMITAEHLQLRIGGAR